ncbi:hypothetical protein MMC07_001071 [Pseudocyphellaria aurata]|nr:hypothetical protein [Pseudocyphellaria aurata]
MPLSEEDQQRVDEAEKEASAPGSNKLLVRDPTDPQKLGPFTVTCLILNRMIGSGIFVSPAIVLRATGSVGASLFLWSVGAIAGLTGLLVWLELGLSIPKFQPPESANEPRFEGERPFINIPRNGGEKNYLEYIYKSPKFRTTCMYGTIFVILGNRAGNAIAFGIYIMQAANRTGSPSEIRALAVAALTVASMAHWLWRRGGLFLNNVLALLKTSILLAIIVIGFSASAGASFGRGKVHGDTVDPDTSRSTSNFDIHTSFTHASASAASYANSIIFIVYSYGGFDQPFYVLSEVARPKKVFAKTTISAIALVIILFTLVNIAYVGLILLHPPSFMSNASQLCAVSNDRRLGSDLDMATLFFREVFKTEVAPRVMSAIIALSVFGNIFVTTFTASRVKQEIAKEGILPFSLFFATSTTTPFAWIKQRFWPSSHQPGTEKPVAEQSPGAALLLHWTFSVLLIAFTSANSPSVAYTVLVALYSYTLVIIVGFLVAGGLLYLRFSKREEWKANAGFSPWGGPTAAIIYCLICAFAIVGAFLPPSAGSPFAYETTHVQWYIVPTVGLGTLVLGYLYYLGFAVVLPRLKHKTLEVDRDPVIVRQFGRPDGEWVQVMELVEFWWAARGQPPPVADSVEDLRNGDHEMDNLGTAH